VQRKLNTTRLRTCVVLALVVVVSLTIANPVLAAAGNGPCVDGPLPYYSREGGVRVAAAAVGASAYIEGANFALCTNVGNFNDTFKGSFSWVGVEHSGTSGDIYQVGLTKCQYSGYAVCNGTLRYFYAWGWDPGVYGCGSGSGRVASPYTIGLANTSTHFYKVVRTTSWVQFWVDSSIEVSVPAASICWTADAVAFDGETWDGGDQMGDNWTAEQAFTSSLYEPSVGAPWAAPGFGSCTVEGHTANYHCHVDSGSALNIWTDRT
jgi:hypothetical protein